MAIVLLTSHSPRQGDATRFASVTFGLLHCVAPIHSLAALRAVTHRWIPGGSQQLPALRTLKRKPSCEVFALCTPAIVRRWNIGDDGEPVVINADDQCA